MGISRWFRRFFLGVEAHTKRHSPQMVGLIIVGVDGLYHSLIVLAKNLQAEIEVIKKRGETLAEQHLIPQKLTASTLKQRVSRLNRKRLRDKVRADQASRARH